MQIEKPQDLKSGVIPEEVIQTMKPHDLKGGDQEKKEPQRIQE